jgi:hypothetical protein
MAVTQGQHDLHQNFRTPKVRASQGGFFQLALEQVADVSDGLCPLMACYAHAPAVSGHMSFVGPHVLTPWFVIASWQVAGPGGINGVSYSAAGKVRWHSWPLSCTSSSPITVFGKSVSDVTMPLGAIPIPQGTVQGAFQPLQNAFGAVWQTQGAVPSPPLDLLITDMNGQSLLLPCAVYRPTNMFSLHMLRRHGQALLHSCIWEDPCPLPNSASTCNIYRGILCLNPC